MDVARKETDKRLKAMEKRLKEEYEKAKDGITKKWNQYMKKVGREIDGLEKAYKDAKESGDKGKIKKAGMELTKIKREKTLQNEYFKNMIDVTADKIADVNNIALRYVNGQMPKIYSINHNFLNEEAEKFGIDFSLVDEHTVKRLFEKGEIKLPQKKLNVDKDKRWNKKKMTSSVLQGILQGESIPEIAERLEPIVDNNRSAAVKNARTMVTSAECNGRLDGYKELDEEGVILKKVWMATPDDRTRESHLDLDGEERDPDEEFSNGLMFPGDGEGDPSEVYNCRCTMITKIIGFKRKDGAISEIEYEEEEETLHDRQMDKEKERRNKG